MPYIKMAHSTPDCPSYLFVPPKREPTDDLGRAIVAHIKRVKANNWNIHNLPPLPSLSPPTNLLPSNPFGPVVQSMKPRPAALNGSEVVNLYNAVSFTMRHHGVVLNSHITIVWRLMGVRDHAEATRLLTAFNHEVAKWLAVGSEPAQVRKRMTKRAEMGGSEHMYVYVHENARDMGFHTHELAFIPPAKAALFKEWAPRCLARLGGYKGFHEDTIHITVDKSRLEGAAVARCWKWFRYLTKNLHPKVAFRGAYGEQIEGREIFKPSRPFVMKAPVHCAQIASGSRNIWTKAQAGAEFRSRLVVSELGRLYDGSELNSTLR